jgi:hypothetical protein
MNANCLMTSWRCCHDDTQELEIALSQSIDTMRMAEQMLQCYTSGPEADMLRDQADTNMTLDCAGGGTPFP